MTVYVDASVLVAILLREPGWEALDEKLSSYPSVITSPIGVWESVRAIIRATKAEPAIARNRVDQLLGAAFVQTVPIGVLEELAALDAMARFGKGLGHSAALNMGDCFAYACARSNGARLLYKGEDFALTDIEAA